jgi:two-component system nitrate/nitrite response regulator NarL
VSQETSFEKASLVIADDYPLYVEGLSRRAEIDGRLRLTGTAGDADEAVDLCTKTRPDLALVGWFLMGRRGSVLFQQLREASPCTRIVVLGGIVDADVVHEAVALGARGFLAKQEGGPAVLDALYRVSLGLTAFSPAAEACLVDAVRARAKDDPKVPSPRDTQILRMLADGASSRQVADHMFVSEATVKSHLNRLYKKLGVRDRSAAVAQAMRLNWVA